MIDLDQIAACVTAVILSRGTMFEAISGNKESNKAYANASKRTNIDNVRVYDVSRDISLVRVDEEEYESDKVFYDFNTGRIFIEVVFTDKFMNTPAKVCQIYAYILNEIMKYSSISYSMDMVLALSIQFYIKEFIKVTDQTVDDFIENVAGDDEVVKTQLKNRQFYKLLEDATYAQIANYSQQTDIWNRAK